MKKVLILTASFGEGHNTAARNIREALELLSEDAAVEVLDLFALTYGMLNKIMIKTHLQIVQHTPRLWGGIYKWLDSSPMLERNLGMMTRLKNSISDIVDEYQPDCIVSTYPAYGHAIRDLYRDHAERPFRFITVITDSITVNSAWYRAPSDYFCVANTLTAEVLRDAGVSEEQIKVHGFPVSPLFAEKDLPEIGPPGESDETRVLYLINCGRKKAARVVDRLLTLPQLKLTVTVGKDAELKSDLLTQTREYGQRVEILGWTNEMPALMRSHHLVISKAGGATVQETIAARCPLIVNQIIPGQEEGNAQLIQEQNLGDVAEDAKAVVRSVERAFAHGAEVWREWRRNLQKFSMPDASYRIAELVLNSCERGGCVSPGRKLFVNKPSASRLPTPRDDRPDRRMLLCDLHIHSNYSDGVLSVPELVDFYGRHDFDCICITDHLADPRRIIGKLTRLSNLTLSPSQLDEYFTVIEREKKRALRRYGMLLMTGIEFNKDGLTKKSSAHLLGIDLQHPIDPALDLPETIRKIHAQGGLAVASHPHIMRSEWGKNTLYLWHNQDTYAPMIDAWEIGNRNNIFTPIGLKSLPFIANSDFHKPKHIYSWKTLLHCEKEPQAIKECIRENKHVAITLFRKQESAAGCQRAFREERERTIAFPEMPLRLAN